jgi:hypothetical protein
VPEAIMISELWRKTGGVVPHYVVQRGVRRMDVFFSADDRGMPQSVISIGSERVCGAKRAAGGRVKKEIRYPGSEILPTRSIKEY